MYSVVQEKNTSGQTLVIEIDLISLRFTSKLVRLKNSRFCLVMEDLFNLVITLTLIEGVLKLHTGVSLVS